MKDITKFKKDLICLAVVGSKAKIKEVFDKWKDRISRED